MAHQVKWTKKTFELFCDLAMLSDTERFIMKTRIESRPISWQANQLNMSEANVHKIISKLKKKYDAVQLDHPEDLPPRRKSEKETWMDSN